MSEIMSALILLGIVGAGAAIAAYAFFGQADTITQTDAMTPSNIALIDVGDSTYISANVKNTGSADLSALEILVEIDTDGDSDGVQSFKASFGPAQISPGQTATVNAEILDSTDAAIAMSSGQEYLVTIKGVTADGGQISYPTSSRVR